MSTKIYATLALNPGFSTFDPHEMHSQDEAARFMDIVGAARFSKPADYSGGRLIQGNDVLVFANGTGVAAFSADLALSLALCGKPSRKAAGAYGILLSVAYNDQCLVDVFSFFENGRLVRHVCEMDGYGPSDIVSKGALLEEEKGAIRNEALSASDLDDFEADELGQFEVDGETYTIEGRVPLMGCGLKVSERFLDGGLEAFWPVSGSVFQKKPWWRLW